MTRHTSVRWFAAASALALGLLAVVTARPTIALAQALAGCGDANGDGGTQATDALFVLRRAVGQPATCPMCACDVNADRRVAATDALAVLRRAVGIVRYLACEGGAECVAAQPHLVAFEEAGVAPAEPVRVTAESVVVGEPHLLRLIDAAGAAIEIPTVHASDTRIVAGAPPVSAAKTFVVQAIEGDGNDARSSDALRGLEVSALQPATGPAGRVTLDFLDGAIALAQELLTDPPQPIAPQLADEMQSTIAMLTSLRADVQAIVADAAATRSLGSLRDAPLVLGAADLATVDAMILATLHAQATAEPEARGGLQAACRQPEALGYYNNLLNGTPTTASRPSYFTAPCAAETTEVSLSVVLGAAAIATGVLALVGAPAIALALPAAAVLYVGLAAGGGLIVVGDALRTTTAESRVLVEAGVKRVESTMRGFVLDRVLPDAAGALFNLIDGTKDLYDAFTAGVAPPTTTTTQVTSTTGPTSTTSSTTNTVQSGDDCWCCCAFFDDVHYTCQEGDADISAEIEGNCFYYAASSQLCGTGFCEAG